MEKYTGNYINIGLISDRKNFREKVVRLISSSDKFWCKKLTIQQMKNIHIGWKNR